MALFGILHPTQQVHTAASTQRSASEKAGSGCSLTLRDLLYFLILQTQIPRLPVLVPLVALVTLVTLVTLVALVVLLALFLGPVLINV